MQEMADVGHILEHVVDDAGVGADFDTHDNELAVKQFKPVPGPRALEGTGDFLGRQHFRINEVVDAQGGEVLAPVGIEELIVVDAGNRFFSTQPFCHGA